MVVSKNSGRIIPNADVKTKFKWNCIVGILLPSTLTLVVDTKIVTSSNNFQKDLKCLLVVLNKCSTDVVKISKFSDHF